MDAELQTISNVDLPAKAVPTAFSQVGDKNIQVAHANTINYTVLFPSIVRHASSGGVRNVGFALNTDYYNLFVIGDETFSDGHFTVPKDRALTEGMSPDTIAQFSSLSDAAISQIKTFPALFASENHGYGKTDDAHQAYFGLVTDVRIQDNGIKIYFQSFSTVSQQLLNELAFKIALQKASSFNEFNRTHWAIKRINLI